MEGLAGRTAIVTGGSRGIGRAIVLDLAKQGVKVIFSYLKNKEAADEVVKLVENSGHKAQAVPADVRKVEDAKNLFAAAAESGGPDFLVNNAGIVHPTSIAFMSDDAWKDVLDTNLDGTFFLCRSMVQTLLKSRKSGSIVNISSLSGTRAAGGQANYVASKAAVIALTKSLARELAPHGIRINAVAPGWIDTDMIESVPKEEMAAFLKAIPMGRVGEPSEVAKMVSFLLSDFASYVTGSLIHIDGGMGA